MVKVKKRSLLKNMVVMALIASVFVGVIALGSFEDSIRALIAAGATFVIVVLGFAAINLATKDEKIVPGEPRLK